ncbi:MAG: hypothetical protein ABIH46_12015 [Chloroflexota bacterium]
MDFLHTQDAVGFIGTESPGAAAVYGLGVSDSVGLVVFPPRCPRKPRFFFSL